MRAPCFVEGPRGRPPAIPFALLALALAGAGCNVPGARIHNLKVLHENTGRHAASGHLVSGFEYYLRHGAGDLFGERLSSSSGPDSPFRDPLRACMANASALARIESDDERVTAAQVAQLAWLAVDDPWKLSREICVQALGIHGLRLGVEVPGARSAEPAGADEVRQALAALVGTVRSSGALRPVAEGDEATAAVSTGSDTGTGIESACAAIEALELDRSGALRLVRGIGALEMGLRSGGERSARLRRTLHLVEQRLVAETLLLALKDEPPREADGSHPGWYSPRVRAAAVRACVLAFGDSALGELLLQLDRERTEEVLQAVLGEVAAGGLPEAPAGLPAEARGLLRERWIDTILMHAYDSPSGPVRVAAMRALARISEGELESLREEDWLAWHMRRRGNPVDAGASGESR